MLVLLYSYSEESALYLLSHAEIPTQARHIPS
jgi:hypothetical protein